MELITCERCGFKFPDNPKKHMNRTKYCPQCRMPYSLHKGLSDWINLRWIKEKLLRKQRRDDEKWVNFQKRIYKSLTASLKRRPTHLEFTLKIMNSLTKEDKEKYDKWERKRREVRK